MWMSLFRVIFFSWISLQSSTCFIILNIRCNLIYLIIYWDAKEYLCFLVQKPLYLHRYTEMRRASTLYSNRKTATYSHLQRACLAHTWAVLRRENSREPGTGASALSFSAHFHPTLTIPELKSWEIFNDFESEYIVGCKFEYCI